MAGSQRTTTCKTTHQRIRGGALVLLLWGTLASGILYGQQPRLEDTWKANSLAQPRFVIHGSDGRSNPLRRPLVEPFRGDQLFVRYRLRYDETSIDTASNGDGEFFVLWLDSVEGDEGSTHTGGTPNVGVHVDAQGKNRFMVRYSSARQVFGPELVGDRDYLVVARLSKSVSGAEAAFDRLEFWLDPLADSRDAPQASVSDPRALSAVRCIGFSTGRKTESADRVTVWDIDAAGSWEELFGLPAPSPKPPEPTISFQQDVLPILKRRCFECHSGAEPSSEYRLDVWDEVLNHTAPRSADDSRLYQLIAAGEMPPEGQPLTKAERHVIGAWINEGLSWDETLLPTPRPKTDHWSFLPLRSVRPPTIENARWVRTPVDAFVGRRHEEHDLTPAPEASPETLRRRITLDMTGLPPDPNSPDEMDVLLDSLIGSTEYGERWARHWLDVARWAESNGHQHNRARSHAWRYRDWVIDAFASDKPYRDFVREQIAGDLLTPHSDEALVATGFLAAARYSGNELDKEIQRNDILVDVANTTARAFLGLSLECAQCHTHKFDPLTIRDYYQFQAIFADSQPANVVFEREAESSKLWIAERWRIFETAQERLIQARRRQGQPPVVTRSAVMGSMKAAEKTRLRQLDAMIAKTPQTWAYHRRDTSQSTVAVAPHDMRFPLPRPRDNAQVAPTRLLIRGDVKSPGPVVLPALPSVFNDSLAGELPPRAELANWLVKAEHPFTARVWVNRIWQWHFGAGLVETSGDFGFQGARPTFPDLLDFLAGELIRSGWKTSRIHRLIVNSATYRQSSTFSDQNARADSENRFLWRWLPRRLESEAIRDSLLAVSGRLERSRGGPSAAFGSRRRSIYLRNQRDRLPDHQTLFDAAGGSVSCSRRRVSTTAIQPLWLLNSSFVQEAAVGLAERAGSLKKAARLAWGRDLDQQESRELSDLAARHGLASACLVMLNSSEFVYIP